MNHLPSRSTSTPSSGHKPEFYVNHTKPELAQALSTEKKDNITTTASGSYIIQADSPYIPLSIIASDHTSAIDSVVKLDPHTTQRISTTLQDRLSGLQHYQQTHTREHATLSLLQKILDKELGIIGNISAAETEQGQAIQTSTSGIIDAKSLSYKMCALRAGYTMKTLKSLGRNVTTVCGTMDGKGHARNTIQPPSGNTLLYDPMNPLTSVSYRYVNTEKISSTIYQNIKNGSYTGSMMSNGHTYKI